MSYSEPILIVDDDPIFHAVATDALCNMGVTTVTSAENGEAGLQSLLGSGRPVGLIILDLNMPQLDGLAFMRAISETGFDGQVLISSGEDGSIIKSAFNMGRMLNLNIVGTIRKPLVLDQLKVVLDRCGEISELNRTTRQVDDSIDPAKVQIVPFYQPQIRLSDRSLCGAEALSRLDLGDGRFANPNGFFARQSQKPEARDIAFTVIRKVFSDVRDRRNNGLVCDVSINLDVTVAEKSGCAEELIGVASEHAINPESITIELTETALPSEAANLLESLTRMRMAGFALSLDDYGTGGANFDLLQMGPFSELKVDLSIVQAAEFDVISARFLETIVEFSAKLGLRTVAEGIETESQMEMVANIGLDIAQGYLFGRAEPDMEFRRRLLSPHPERLVS